ncbi:hypothetical protein CAC42_5680 [Sphaceloma murrayae]|uniref:Uncharacterized protein n=1 Tax=Sphaceloma murrayae TaxID=2082308 RepID=A0A2K1QZ14_9PEZI|nr:hypothetical protein CAC42_5680 [Sphaceloma murrayae]
MADQADQQKPSMLPTLPSITTTISSLLSSPLPDQSVPNTANDHSMASPASFANFLPSTPTWWRGKAATKSAGNSPQQIAVPERLSSEEMTRRGSDESIGESAKKRKRNPRPKTCFSLCHAPPRHGGRHKIQVRARPLLQLHKIESRSRPRPAFELLPSAVFSARLIKAIAKFSVNKHGLSPTDLAIVRAEKYHAHEASPVEEDESRDILALVCGIGKGHMASNKVRICLEGGVEWEACQLPTGSYEMTSTDAHGLKQIVRWVPKRCRNVTSPGVVSPTITSPTETSFEKKFNFSTISQNTRRHPIIAHLTSTSLDISDVYTLPAPSMSVDSANPTPISPQFHRTSSDDTTSSSTAELVTTEDLRNLITATAIYVALCEKWCTTHRSEDSLSRSCSQKSVSPSKPAQSPSKRPPSLDSDSLRRSSSLRQALRSPGFRRKTNEERPGSSSSSLALDTSVGGAQGSGITTIPEGKSPAVSTRRRADTTSTVIVNGNGGQWRMGDETDDDEEEEEDGNDEEKAESPTTDLGSRPSGEKKRNFSDSSSRGSQSSGETMGKEKVEVVQMEKTEKKSGWRRLLCGFV